MALHWGNGLGILSKAEQQPVLQVEDLEKHESVMSVGVFNAICMVS